MVAVAGPNLAWTLEHLTKKNSLLLGYVVACSTGAFGSNHHLTDYDSEVELSFKAAVQPENLKAVAADSA